MKRIFAVFTALLILCSGLYANAERNGSSSSKIGENISGFVSETIHGENINGAVFAQKKITVLHYFSTWSAVCINEMEYMQTAADGFSDDRHAPSLWKARGTLTIAFGLIRCWVHLFRNIT